MDDRVEDQSLTIGLADELQVPGPHNHTVDTDAANAVTEDRASTRRSMTPRLGLKHGAQMRL
jgi:hypothetical protein